MILSPQDHEGQEEAEATAERPSGLPLCSQQPPKSTDSQRLGTQPSQRPCSSAAEPPAGPPRPSA